MDKKDCQLYYLNEDKIETDLYKKFLATEYADYEKYHKRINWYASHDIRILVAEIDGEYVGQSCAHKVIARINGKDEEFWWSGDTFVITAGRGLGIGKKLQNKLHKDLINFSSVWYTPINGIIKRKCGAKEILDVPFTYYPVSNFFTILFELVWEKIFKRKIHFRINLPYFYYHINNLFRTRISRGYTVHELNVDSINEDLADFMAECLKDESFYIKRDVNYLKWKYIEDPNTKYHMLEVRNKGKRIGIVSFSKVHNGLCVLAKARISHIYDSLFLPDCGLNHKSLLLLVMEYYYKKGEYLDGIFSLQDIHYLPKLIYPWPSGKLLSTYEGHVETGYITYLDQDMEQM